MTSKHKMLFISDVTRIKKMAYRDRSQDGRGLCLVVTADFRRRHDTMKWMRVVEKYRKRGNVGVVECKRCIWAGDLYVLK